MKKKIAKMLVVLAKKLDHQVRYENEELYSPVRYGFGIRIEKNDLRDFRKRHPEYKSSRQSLDAFIKEAKQTIIRHIAAGMVKEQLLTFEVSKGIFTGEVSGSVVVYRPKAREDAEPKDESQDGHQNEEERGTI